MPPHSRHCKVAAPRRIVPVHRLVRVRARPKEGGRVNEERVERAGDERRRASSTGATASIGRLSDARLEDARSTYCRRRAARPPRSIARRKEGNRWNAARRNSRRALHRAELR